MSDEFPKPSGDCITDRKRQRAAESKSASSFAAPPCSPAPSWANFCEHIRQVWPEMIPDAKDTKWTNLYTVYEIGYGACLLHMQKLLEQENS